MVEKTVLTIDIADEKLKALQQAAKDLKEALGEGGIPKSKPQGKPAVPEKDEENLKSKKRQQTFSAILGMSRNTGMMVRSLGFVGYALSAILVTLKVMSVMGEKGNAQAFSRSVESSGKALSPRALQALRSVYTPSLPDIEGLITDIAAAKIDPSSNLYASLVAQRIDVNKPTEKLIPEIIQRISDIATQNPGREGLTVRGYGFSNVSDRLINQIIANKSNLPSYAAQLQNQLSTLNAIGPTEDEYSQAANNRRRILQSQEQVEAAYEKNAIILNNGAAKLKAALNNVATALYSSDFTSRLSHTASGVAGIIGGSINYAMGKDVDIGEDEIYVLQSLVKGAGLFGRIFGSPGGKAESSSLISGRLSEEFRKKGVNYNDPNIKTMIRFAKLEESIRGLKENSLVSQLLFESAYNPYAESSAGAQGLGQIMPANSRKAGIDPLNWKQNILLSAKLNQENLKRFKGNQLKAWAVYNGGNRAVTKEGNLNINRETVNYLANLLRANPEIEKSYSPEASQIYKAQQLYENGLTGRVQITISDTSGQTIKDNTLWLTPAR